MLCQFRRKLILSGQVVCFLSNVSIFISRFPTCCLKFRSAALACLPIRHALFSTALVCNTGPATGIDGLTPKQCSLVQQSQCNGKWHQTCTCIHFNHVVHKSSRLWAATALVTGGTIAFQVLRSDTSAKTMQGIQKHERNHANTSQTLRMQHKSCQNSEDESCQRAAPQKLQYPSSTPQDTRCKASLSQESCPGTSLSETLHLQRNVAHMYSAHEIIRLLFNVRVQRPSEQHY